MSEQIGSFIYFVERMCVKRLLVYSAERARQTPVLTGASRSLRRVWREDGTDGSGEFAGSILNERPHEALIPGPPIPACRLTRVLAILHGQRQRIRTGCGSQSPSFPAGMESHLLGHSV